MIRYRGVAYYPEFWPEDRWDEDIRLMKDAGINLVRVGEFAWTALEPAEGRFNLDWLRRIVGKFGDAGMEILLCTPTAAPPAWLTAQYPETLLVRKDGRRAAHGARRHYCPTNETYRGHVSRIVDRLSRTFAGCAQVIAWQMDNEIGPEMSFCHCDHCSVRFRAWLQNRYGSLASLNSAWQTRFWSMAFTDWEQINLRLEAGFPAMELDIRRFHSDCYIDFVRHQGQIIRANVPKALITTNMVGPPLLPFTDYFRLAESLDLIADDLYFDAGTMDSDALACDFFRCAAAGRPFWITETGSAGLRAYKAPDPRQLRTWAYSALARGCEGYSFFRWRTCPAGQEQDLQGILDTSGVPGDRYQAVKELFHELAHLEAELADLPDPRADVAFILSYDAHWAFETAPAGSMMNYERHVQDLYRLLFDRKILADMVPPTAPLDCYRLLILPSLCMVDDDLAARLAAYVRRGGTVLATPQLASRDMNSNYHAHRAPYALVDLFGCEVACHTYLESAAGPDEAIWSPAPHLVQERPLVRIDTGEMGFASRYMEKIEPTGGQNIGVYLDNLYAGTPAAIRCQTGHGLTWYVAAYLDEHLLGAILDQALAGAGIAVGPKTKPWVEVVRRGTVTFIMNHGHTEAEVHVGQGQALVGDVRAGTVVLAPYGVAVVRG